MTLEESIAKIWENSGRLCSLVDFSRVFTGRIPSSRLYDFPYVSIKVSSGASGQRTDKTRQYFQPVSFMIWVDEDRLTFGDKVAKAIADVYADGCWQVDDGTKVLDARDGGPGGRVQVPYATVKTWKIIQQFMLRIESMRGESVACCDEASLSASESFSSSSS